MAAEQTEREDKYDVSLDFVVPALGDLVPDQGREDIDTIRLDSVYFDTADRDLLRHHLTLRRRSGDDDLGWQLKVPAGDARTEVRLPPTGDESVPDELANAVSGVALGKPLLRVASLSTVRRRHRVVDSDGNSLAELADDSVRATATAHNGGAIASQWREVEVELGDHGQERLLRDIGGRLVRSGAHTSSYASKLARALALEPHRADDDSENPARRALTDYLGTQIDEIVAGDVWLRRGLDPIHATRVAIRRFRSTLRVFKDLVDPDARSRLEDELVWYAGLLGEVRDRQVQRHRLGELVAGLPAELVMGPVAARIEQDLLGEQLHCLTVVMSALDDARYRDLLVTLAQWRTAPPLTIEPGAGPKVIAKAVKRAGRKARKRLTAAVADSDATELHRARKAAKRARYAAELATPLLGGKAEKKVSEYKHVQKVLGEHQDSVLAADNLRALGARAGVTEGENGFTFGLLYALELENARQARADAAHLVK